ncbi:MAG: hypothetical protein Q3976_07780 [Corynebacterium sp.]|nr:hypothetical protein [Corynebacterium sp.]
MRIENPQQTKDLYIPLCCVLTSSAVAPVAFAQEEPASVATDETIHSREPY